MTKQKICIIGGGLTGLITSIVLSKLNLHIDLITGNLDEIIKSSRTTAISQSNLNFLIKSKVFNFSKKQFWPCSRMKIYNEINQGDLSKIFELNGNKKEKKEILYMIENSKIAKHLIKKIKKINHISLKKNKIISSVESVGILKSIKFNNTDNTKYNLVIICTGNKSTLVNTTFENQFLERSYNEIGITTVLKHEYLKNNVVRQFFLDNGILALLPLSNNKTSVVWSVSKNILNKEIQNKNLFLKNKIKICIKPFFKKIKFINNIEIKSLNFLLRKKYYRHRVLLFGDALHEVHPLAGQGFNMILRDLKNLKDTLENRINLGLDIGSNEILNEFSYKIKPRNFVSSVGMDLIKNYFTFERQKLKNIRNEIVIKLNKNNFAKKLFLNIADEGIKF